MSAAIDMSEAPSLHRPADRELVVTRVLDAPRQLVFKAWTDPTHVVRWWGTHGSTPTSCVLDPCPGGVIRFSMRTCDGRDCTHRGVFREIVEPERLVFSFAWQREDGGPGHETLVTVTLADQDGKTRLSLHQAVFDSVEARDAHAGGWSEALERLAVYVASV